MDLAPILQAIAKTENVAILILIVICAFLCRAIVVIRQEDRAERIRQEERAASIQMRNNVVLDKVADAITEMRIAIAVAAKVR